MALDAGPGLLPARLWRSGLFGSRGPVRLWWQENSLTDIPKAQVLLALPEGGGGENVRKANFHLLEHLLCAKSQVRFVTRAAASLQEPKKYGFQNILHIICMLHINFIQRRISL